MKLWVITLHSIAITAVVSTLISIASHVYTLEAQKHGIVGRDIEPPVSANLDVAGAGLVSVLFGDYRDDFFQPAEEVDVVREH